MELAAATIDDFSDRVGDIFVYSENGVNYPLLLKEATQKCGGMPGGRKPFLLIFSGPAGIGFNQGNYLLTNDRFGKIELFMVPGGWDGDSFILHAVFN